MTLARTSAVLMHAARMKAPRDGIAPYSGLAYDMRHMKPTARLIQMITLGGQVGLFRLGYGMCNYRSQSRRAILREIVCLQKERRFPLTPLEAHQLWCAAASTAKVPGAIAEVGVFQGGSAKLLSLALPGKPLHLFDTFQGLPDACPELEKGDYFGSYDRVKAYLPNALLHRGLFPRDTGATVAAERFCFVHLDMDLYEGTRDALAFFYDRLAPGGIILTHDYIQLPGPTKAFEEFFASRREPLIALSGFQCMAVKVSAP